MIQLSTYYKRQQQQQQQQRYYHFVAVLVLLVSHTLVHQGIFFVHGFSITSINNNYRRHHHHYHSNHPYNKNQHSIGTTKSLLVVSLWSNDCSTSTSNKDCSTTTTTSTGLFGKLPTSTTTTSSSSSIGRRNILIGTTQVALSSFVVATTTTTEPVSAAVVETTSSSSSILSYQTVVDNEIGYVVDIPTTYIKTIQKLQDRRDIILYSDPNDGRVALFVVATPIRDDYTSLSSFGSVDQVAQQTILPKSTVLSDTTTNNSVQATMVSALSKNQIYYFDYIQSTSIQPLTHYRTIFTLVSSKRTDQAGSILVTITAQCPENLYDSTYQPIFDTIINSYRKA